MNRLQAHLSRRYLDRLFRSPRGRAFVLWQASAAEGTDEGRFFDVLLERVDDPQLQKVIERHRDDEIRHAELFAEAARRTGQPAFAVPADLQLLERLDRALGGFFEAFAGDRRTIMDAYLLLQVIEERALTQFRELEPALRRHDVHAADILREIARDEERHLKYCAAVAKRYAPDTATREQTLAHFREVENRVFAEHSRDVMSYALDHKLVQVTGPEAMFWRGLVALGARRNHTRPTPYFRTPAVA